VIWQAKGIFGSATILLIVGTAFVTWRAMSALDNSEIAGLNATITSLQATIQYQSARLEAYSKGPPIAGGVLEARLQITQTGRIDVNGHVGVNVFMQNVGNSAAIGLIQKGNGFFGDKGNPVNEQRVDKLFADLKKGLAPFEALNLTSETQPNSVSFFTTEFPDISSTEMDSRVVNGDDAFLFGVMIEYRDAELSKSQWRVTELCLISLKKSADHLCSQHNRIYTSGN
jgi:hypothetical protein